MDRKDFKFISGWIEKDSTVLDLGAVIQLYLTFSEKTKCKRVWFRKRYQKSTRVYK